MIETVSWIDFSLHYAASIVSSNLMCNQYINYRFSQIEEYIRNKTYMKARRKKFSKENFNHVTTLSRVT